MCDKTHNCASSFEIKGPHYALWVVPFPLVCLYTVGFCAKAQIPNIKFFSHTLHFPPACLKTT